MGQKYATLNPRQLYLMIHSLKILKCSMMGYNSQTKVLLVNLPKKFPFWLRAFWAQFGPNLCNLMFHVSLSGDLFEVFWHYEVQKIDKISLNHFSRNLLLGQYGSNLARNCKMLHQINYSRDFYKHSSMMWCNISHICQFSKKIPFLDQWQLRQKWCNLILMIYPVAIFLKWQSMMGYNSQTKAILVNFSKKYPFGEVTCTQFGPKLCNLLSYDLLFVDFFKNVVA